ncbi:MAG: hypothetical protein K6G81_00440 [Lachnospiraceae bacterium]|nr:hypothetical protein [Lachnospiraceae bacterium]
MKEKIVSIMKLIFGIGVTVCLLVGGITFFGYLAAIIIGGDAAATICTFIYKTLYPILVYISTAMILLGTLKMYICGETEFSPRKKGEKSEAEA